MEKVQIKHAAMRPIFKVILWIFGGLLILLLMLQIFISLFADEYAGSYLKDQVRESSHNRYTLTFDDLDLSLFSGSASITNLQIHSDTSAFSAARSASPAKTIYRGTIGRVDVEGVNIFSTLWGNTLHIGSISISEPDIKVVKNPHKIAQKDSSKHSFSTVDSTIYAAISKKYDRLELNDFKISNAKLLFSQSADTISSADSLNLELQNIAVDSASAHSGRKFVTDDISFGARNFTFNLPDSLNKIRVNRLAISSENQSIELDSLQLIPLYPRFKFGRRNGVEIDRINLTVPEVKFHDVNFPLFVDSARFHSRFAEINHAHMEDFRNKNLPFPPNNHPSLPHTALRNMKQKLKIDSLKINDSFISYSEYWYETPRAGNITFDHLNATIKNITNYPEDIANGETIVMDANAGVMGQAELDTHFEFPMDTKNGFHKVSGTLQKVPFSAFNPMLKYVAFVEADQGTLNSLKFDMTLNSTSSSGTVIMNYENLKVSVLDKKSIQQKGILENLKTFAANNFIVRKNNTPEDGMRAGQIKFDRVQRKSVFNYWWKSLLSGIKNTVSSI